MPAPPIPEIVRTAITLLPELARIPGLGQLLIFLNKVPQNDSQALEEMQREFNKKKREREKRRDKNSRYLIKVSEAMECVDKHFDNTNLVWDFVKSIASLVSGGSIQFTDAMRDQIHLCIEENRLRQDTPRVIGSPKGKYVRPRKGHGHGRGKF